MSVENLKKYGIMCAEKDDVRAKAKEIGVDNADGQIAYAKELGLEFSRQDMEDLAKEAGITGNDELSEEDLEKVAGGISVANVVIGVVSSMVNAISSIGKKW